MTSNGVTYKVIYDMSTGRIFCVSSQGERIPAPEFDFSQTVKSDSFANGNGGFANDIDGVGDDEFHEGYGDDNASSKIDPVTGKPRVSTNQPVYSEEENNRY